MYSKEDAVKIQNKVNESKILLWKRSVDNIMGVEIEYYLYSNLQERQKHIERQKNNDWIYDDLQKEKETFYVNFFNSDEEVLIYSAYFRKPVENSIWS